MILPFKKAAPSGWRPDELAECFRVVDLLIRAGLPVSIQTGVSDEGEPWGVVVRDDTGDILLHLARTDGQFLVASAAGTSVQRGRTLREVVNAAFSTGELALASQRARLREGDVLRLHPSALMAAVIVTAWLHTETGRDMPAASRPDRSETGGLGTGAVRPGSDASSHTPHPTVLMKAAVSFAAVVAMLETSSNGWVPLELDIDALIALAAAPQLILSGTSLLYAGMEANTGTRSSLSFEALENILGDVPAHIPFRSEAPIEVAPAETALPTVLTAPSGNNSPNVLVPLASSAASVVTSWSTSALASPSLALSFPDRAVALTLPGGGQHGEPIVVTLISGTMDPPLNQAEPQNSPRASLNAPVHGTVPVSQSSPASASIPVGATDPMASATRQTASATPSLALILPASAESATLPNPGSLSGSEASPFFRAALQFLHLERGFLTEGRSVGSLNLLSFSNVNASTGLHTFKSSWSTHGTLNASLVVFSTPNLPEAESVATIIPVPAPNLAPVETSPSTQPTGAANDRVVSTTLPAAPALDQPVIPSALPTAAAPGTVAAAPPAPSVPYNTQLLLNFTADATHAAKGSVEARSAMIGASQDTAGASRIVVFDASWLSGKAFMLMPGVAMVENDLFAGAARIALPPAAPVTLELGDGLSVQLLGILTV